MKSASASASSPSCVIHHHKDDGEYREMQRPKVQSVNEVFPTQEALCRSARTIDNSSKNIQPEVLSHVPSFNQSTLASKRCLASCLRRAIPSCLRCSPMRDDLLFSNCQHISWSIVLRNWKNATSWKNLAICNALQAFGEHFVNEASSLDACCG